MGKKIGKLAGTVSGGLTGAGFLGGIIGGAGGGEVGKLAEGITGVNLTDAFDDVTDSSSISRVILGEQSALEKDAFGLQSEELNNLRQALTAGGMEQLQGDITSARGAQMDLASMLQQAQRGPSSQNVSDAQRFANDIFAPQQQAMQQQFQQAETETSRLAARLGRQVDDPILRAKLAEAQGAQMGQLQAQKGAFTAQTAQGFQQQGLGMQNQLAQLRGGLATQALQNRQALMGMGQSLLNQERNFRLNTATRTGNSQTIQQGGLGDVIGAVTGGIGAFAGLGK